MYFYFFVTRTPASNAVSTAETVVHDDGVTRRPGSAFGWDNKFAGLKMLMRCIFEDEINVRQKFLLFIHHHQLDHGHGAGSTFSVTHVRFYSTDRQTMLRVKLKNNIKLNSKSNNCNII